MSQRTAQCAWGVTNFFIPIGDYGYNFNQKVTLTVDMDRRTNLTWGVSTIANPGGLSTEIRVKVFAVYARHPANPVRAQIGADTVFNITAAATQNIVNVVLTTNAKEVEVEFSSATIANATLVAFDLIAVSR